MSTSLGLFYEFYILFDIYPTSHQAWFILWGRGNKNVSSWRYYPFFRYLRRQAINSTRPKRYCLGRGPSGTRQRYYPFFRYLRRQAINPTLPKRYCLGRGPSRTRWLAQEHPSVMITRWTSDNMGDGYCSGTRWLAQ